MPCLYEENQLQDVLRTPHRPEIGPGNGPLLIGFGGKISRFSQLPAIPNPKMVFNNVRILAIQL